MVPQFSSTDSFHLFLPNDPSLKAQALKLSSLEQFINSFTQGQVVSGKVLGQLASGKSLVELGGHRAAVQFNTPHSQGQVFQAKVEQLLPTPVFKILTSNTGQASARNAGDNPGVSNTVLRSDQVRVSEASQRTLPTPRIYSLNEITKLGLQKGQEAQAQVRSITDNTFVQARINNQDVSLVHPRAGSLKEGSPLTIRAEPRGDGFTLSASGAEKNNPALKLLQSLLPDRQSLPQIIKNFETEFARFTENNANTIPKLLKGRLQESLQVLKTSSGELLDTGKLQENVARTGASYEARLKQFLESPTNAGFRNALTQDFKGQLQELSKVLEQQFGPGFKGGDTVAQTLGRQTQAVIQNLDIHQLTQVVARQENHPMTLLIPNMLEHQGRPIKVFYREEDGGGKNKVKEGNNPYTLVFFLELSRLGNVRLDARVQEEKLGLNIAVENPEVLNFIESGFSVFKEHLDELGFESEITGAVNPEKVQETIEEFPEPVLMNLNSLVDLRT